MQYEGNLLFTSNLAGLSTSNNWQVPTHSNLAIAKNKLFTTLPYVGKEYRVKFDLFPTVFRRGWSNVIHFSVNGDVSQYGDRIPAVYFPDSSSTATSNVLHICSAVNGDKNHCHNPPWPRLQRNIWSTVEIAQTKVSNYYVYAIHLNHKLVYKTTNTDARQFSNVKVYVGDPFYDAQPGFIRNLTVYGKDFICVVFNQVSLILINCFNFILVLRNYNFTLPYISVSFSSSSILSFPFFPCMEFF